MKFLGRIRKKSCRNCRYFVRISTLMMRGLPWRGTFCMAKQKEVNENYPKWFCMSFAKNRGVENELRGAIESNLRG